MTRMRLDAIDGRHLLELDCGELPVDEVVMAAGHEPNGDFWDGIATLLAPEVVQRLELDSEGGMFCAYGARADLEQLQSLIEPVLTDGEAIGGLLDRAAAEGFEFDA
ncbi:Imm51 family immunity protein [Arsenicicoccus dermatophilus]|uniref:Imm51 family immunity protein n=1 Tax=Arsenicicoccus dermatophilus TaxID=1076331 RepID=UPI001F4D29DF|nr:Imm51 family immunity protein [Arsenicicoccus dermatophilus]MCH8611824.1 immunity 51 family protein [Arsenicicoccus dermatophilus]